MTEALTGSLSQLPLADLLKMLTAAGQSGHIEVVSGLDHADLFLASGEFVHAECDMRIGEDAFALVATWPDGQFRFHPGVKPPAHSIERPLDRLLADVARAASEREAVRRVVPNLEVIPRLVKVAPAPTVTIDAADWPLMATIDGRLTAAELSAELHTKDIEVAKALYRLKLAGLVELNAPQAAAAQPRPLAGPGFFHALNTAVASALGPLAEIIVDDAVEDLGFTRATFPRDAVADLAERIASEIREPDKRVRFQQAMLHMLRGSQAA